MYTEDALLARRAVRTHPAVGGRQQLTRWRRGARYGLGQHDKSQHAGVVTGIHASSHVLVRRRSQVVEAVRAWWRWLPKSSTRVVVLGEADELVEAADQEAADQEAEAEAADQEGEGGGAAGAAAAGREGKVEGEGAAGGGRRGSRAGSDPDDVFAATLDCPIYSAMVVAITLVRQATGLGGGRCLYARAQRTSPIISTRQPTQPPAIMRMGEGVVE